MSDRLERRCRALLRAYPRTFRDERGDEVLATLLDASAGRRAPRAGDVLDVVGHGLATRVRRRPGSAAAALWGDAAAVALVGVLTVLVAYGIALLVRWGAVVRATDLPHYGVEDIAMAHALGVAGVAALGAVYAGAQRAARWLAVVAVGGTFALALHFWFDVIGTHQPRGPYYLVAAAAGGGLVLAALLGTDAVRRAAVVPRAAWGVAFAASLAAALGAVRLDFATKALRAPVLLSLTYAVTAPALLLLALPFRRREPRLAAAGALLTVAAVPVAWLTAVVLHGSRAWPA